MDQMLLNKVDEWLAAHRQEIIDDLNSERIGSRRSGSALWTGLP